MAHMDGPPPDIGAPENSLIVFSSGEEQRTPEFKEKRAQLIGSVNDWLATVRQKRDSGEPLSDGTPIADQAVITRTRFDDLGWNVMEEHYAGASLTGDGTTIPLCLQVVRPDTGQGAEAIEIQGSDPSKLKTGGYPFHPARRRDAVVSFGNSIAGDDQYRYLQFSVFGDGRVEQKFVDANGVHTTRPVSTPVDIGLAQTVFNQISQPLA